MEIVDIRVSLCCPLVYTGVVMLSLGRSQQAACQLDVVELL
jgi:hypothetical protein